MRSRPIDVEHALWWRLRGRKLGGLKFRRQHPIGRYVANFVCLEAHLIVELDGIQHRGSVADVVRTDALKGLEFDVIRFENERLRVDLDRVCEEILDAARLRLGTPHPTRSGSPSPTREKVGGRAIGRSVGRAIKLSPLENPLLCFATSLPNEGPDRANRAGSGAAGGAATVLR